MATKKKSSGKKGAAAKRAARAVGRRSKAVLGLSVPVLEGGVVTAGGLFAANMAAAQAQNALDRFDWAQEWYSRAGYKVATGIVLKMILQRVQPRWANAALGGALAAAALTVAKRFAGERFEEGWGLAGGRFHQPSSRELDRMEREVLQLSNRLEGLVNTSDVYDGTAYSGMDGLSDGNALYQAAGILA